MTRHGALLAGVLLMLAAGACNSITGSEGTEFVIRIYGFAAPDSQAADSTLHVQVNGYVGPTGCYTFRRFETQRTMARLEVTAIGLHKDTETQCPEGVVLLNEPLDVEPPFSEPFELVGHLPDGSVVVDTVHIR